jgi:hypothetical protein
MPGAGVAAQPAKCVAGQSLGAASHPPHAARNAVRAGAQRWPNNDAEPDHAGRAESAANASDAQTVGLDSAALPATSVVTGAAA